MNDDLSHLGQSYGPDSGGCCPICGAKILPDVGGKPQTQHDQAAHDRRKAEDWRPRKLEGQIERQPKPGLYDPPGDPTIPAYVRSLIERRPDLEKEIMENYRAGLRGEKLEADPQPQLPLPKAEPELQRPRRAFGYDD